MKKKISANLAKIEDAKLLLKIHNTSVKRGYFNSKNLIVYKDHIEWFKKKLKSNSKIYIGKNSIKKKFGYVRFDEVKSNIFQVSLFLQVFLQHQQDGNQLLFYLALAE